MAKGALAFLIALLTASGCEQLAPLRPLPPSGAAIQATCNPEARFGEAIPVPGLNRNLGREWRVQLSSDERTAYFSIGTEYVSDVFLAHRATRTEPFGPPMSFPSIEGHRPISVSLSEDGLKVFLESSRSGASRIYSAARRTTGEPFGVAYKLDQAFETDADTAPYVLPNGRAIYYVANRAGKPLLARAPLDGMVAGPASIVEGVDGVYSAVVSPDELVVYHELGFDIAMRTRTSIDAPFGSLTLLDYLAPERDPPFSVVALVPLWISPDGCRLYFSRWTIIGELLETFLMVAEREPR